MRRNVYLRFKSIPKTQKCIWDLEVYLRPEKLLIFGVFRFIEKFKKTSEDDNDLSND